MGGKNLSTEAGCKIWEPTIVCSCGSEMDEFVPVETTYFATVLPGEEIGFLCVCLFHRRLYCYFDHPKCVSTISP